MSRQITNISKVESKSKTHNVTETQYGYNVTSGSSSTVYHVRLGIMPSCTCEWAKYKKQGEAVACSHVQSAYRFAELQNGNSVKFHQTGTDTSRQKRRTVSVGDGVKFVSRKTRKPVAKKLDSMSIDELNAALFG